MLAKLCLSLLILGTAISFPFAERYKKLAVYAFLVILSGICYEFATLYIDQISDSFSLFWMRTGKYRIDINIDSYPMAYSRLLPVFAISGLMAFYSAFLPIEQQSRRIYSLIALNMANLIVLVCSKNLAQLLACVCMADIISQLMIKNSSSAKKYIFYSLFADIGLFMIFAMLQGKIKSFNLEAVGSYKQLGRHKDFVAIATLLFVFIKMGFFMFQSSLLSLKNIKSYKLLFIVSLSGVLGVFFALTKIYALLQITEYSDLVIKIMIMLSAAWGLIGGVVMVGQNQRIVYYNMILHAFALYIFMMHKQYVEGISLSLILGFMASLSLLDMNKKVMFFVRTILVGLWGFVLQRNYAYFDLCYIFLSIELLAFVILAGNVTYFYKYPQIQKIDGFSRIYEVCLIKPVIFIGRGLWLMVDFMFMEKQLSASASTVNSPLKRYVEQFKNVSAYGQMICLIILFLIFAVVIYLKGGML